jgi:hypothetical protein
VGFENRSILYNRLIERVQSVEQLVQLLKADLMESYKNTDSNFPNKLEKLKGQLEKVQDIENQVTELAIVLYNFEP